MTLSIVVAASENNVIGNNNQLLWHLPNDMKFFKNTTWAMPVIMGRKTYESLGKLLVGRTNIVITRNTDWHPEGVQVVHSLDEALAAARAVDAREAYVIGGADIYRQTLPLVHRLYLTRVHARFEGDAHFPDFDPAEWTCISQLDFEPDDRHAYAYSFQIWERNP